jgi:hypothetical protein
LASALFQFLLGEHFQQGQASPTKDKDIFGLCKWGVVIAPGPDGFPRAAQQEEMSVAARRSCRMTTFQ